jgi:AP-1 complex subunit gamma-1
MIKILKGLINSHSQEYETNGVSDPFLQIGILRYFKLMAKDSPAVQDEISDTLAQVLTSG